MSNNKLFRVNGYEYDFAEKSSEFMKTLGVIHSSFLKGNAPFTRTLSVLIEQFQIRQPRRLASDEDPGSFVPDLMKVYKDLHTPLPVSQLPAIKVERGI